MADQAAPSLQDRVTTGLAKIAMTVKSRAWREGGRQWLPPLQAQTLRLLYRRSGQDTTVSVIAGELAVTMPTVSEMLRVLLAKGMVKKIQSKDDHRVYRIELTPKGRREATRLSEWPYLRAATTQLSETEQVTMLRGVIKIIRGLQQQGEVSIARMCVTCQYFRPNQHKDSLTPHHCEYVDAPFADQSLRIDCADYLAAPEKIQSTNWDQWLKTGS